MLTWLTYSSLTIHYWQSFLNWHSCFTMNIDWKINGTPVSLNWHSCFTYYSLIISLWILNAFEMAIRAQAACRPGESTSGRGGQTLRRSQGDRDGRRGFNSWSMVVQLQRDYRCNFWVLHYPEWLTVASTIKHLPNQPPTKQLTNQSINQPYYWYYCRTDG